MTKVANQRCDLAANHIKRLHNIIAPAASARNDNTPGEFADHYGRLSTHRERLLQEWGGLHGDCERIPTEMHAERRKRMAIVRRRTATGSAESEDFNTSWFAEPARLRSTAQNNADAAMARVNSLKTDRQSLQAQLETCEGRIQQLQRRQESLKGRSKGLLSAATAAAEEEREVQKPTLLKRVANAVLFSQKDNVATLLLSVDDQDALNALERELRHTKDQTARDTYRCNNLATLVYAYQQLIDAQQQLADSRRELAKQWEVVADDRREEAEALSKRNAFHRIPIVVLSGMLVTWIAQWLWWVGYIRVAADT